MTLPRRRVFPFIQTPALDHGVILGMYPGKDPTFGIELQRRNDGSTVWNTIHQVEEVGQQNELRFTDYLPNDNRARSYRARHVKVGWTAGAWTDTAVGTPAELPTGDVPPGDDTANGRSTEVVFRVNKQIITEQFVANTTASLGTRARVFYITDGTTGAGVAFLEHNLTGFRYNNGAGLSQQQIALANQSISLGNVSSGPTGAVVTRIRGGLTQRTATSTSTSYTITSDDITLAVNATAAATVTLPALAGSAAGSIYEIVNRSTAYGVTVMAGSTLDTIDGSTSVAIGIRPGVITLQAPSSGSTTYDWWVKNLYD